MPAVEQKRLLEACRALGEAAGGQPMLPPLIREAGENEGSGGTVHYVAVGDAWVRFETRFDKAYVNRHEFPLKRLPLLIDCALCDQERRPQAKMLDEEEKFALLCAFFLAAQTPIGVEPIEDTGDYRLSLRLSSTFVVEWREAFETAALESCETLCRRVASSLWEKSREFFASERVGLAVWSLRAAQELLGAPKLSPRAVEDFVAASLAEDRQGRNEIIVPPLPESRAEALALMMSLGNKSAAMAVAAPPAPLSDFATVLVPSADRLVPLAAPEPAFGGKAWGSVATGVLAAAIPLALMVSVSAFMSLSHQGEVEAPRIEAREAPTPPPAAVSVAALAPVAVDAGAKDALAPTEPSGAESAHTVVDQKPAPDAAAAPPAAPKSRRTGHASGKSRRARNPLTEVQRAVGRFTADVWDGLSSIPKRFGGVSYY
ncbi:hypothetical protein [Methylocystis bryophila]|uniref:Uncharacterized protein n=1 Tax=Methylocystis bryophila TaxID=655015 RepID=A0A1W6MVQ8_9HYPH|nr:hypothetical protein [Methylocystis bryophila]ARN81596.1 hypothetical protein B1812_11530 [Methylocystis bryophila]BDV37634.1 hypothetical protein DSM21852_08870 [Methylocystis bryophila]